MASVALTLAACAIAAWWLKNEWQQKIAALA